MGKKTRLALMAFGAGALQGVSNFYQTKAAQEAEALREQRLAAIRAEERAANQQFQRELLGEQNAAQAERDKRLADQQAARDTAQNEQRMREIEASGKNQRDVAGMYASRQNEQPDQRVIVRDPSGALRAVSLMSDEFAKGLPKGTDIVEGRAGTRFSALPGENAGSAPARGAPASPATNPTSNPPGTGVRQMVYDEKLGRYVLAPPTG